MSIEAYLLNYKQFKFTLNVKERQKHCNRNVTETEISFSIARNLTNKLIRIFLYQFLCSLGSKIKNCSMKILTPCILNDSRYLLLDNLIKSWYLYIAKILMKKLLTHYVCLLLLSNINHAYFIYIYYRHKSIYFPLKSAEYSNMKISASLALRYLAPTYRTLEL